MKQSTLFAAIAMIFLNDAAAQDRVNAFTGARLIDGTGNAPIHNAVLLVRDGRIEQVGPANEVQVPQGAERIDLAGKFVIPGIINAHGHVAGDTQKLLTSFAQYGVTTVVSLGGEGESEFAIRDAQDPAALQVSRLLVAGPVQEHQTAEAAVAGARRVKTMGANWLKGRVQGGMPEAAYSALIHEAHNLGLKVAVHMYSLEDAKGLIRNDVDVLGHSVRDLPVDDEMLGLVRESEMCQIATLTRDLSTFVYESTPEFFADPFFLKHAEPAVIAQLNDPAAQSRMARNAQQGKADLAMGQRNMKALHDAGVRIALGTDSGAGPSRFAGYFEHLEMDLMAEAGLAPMEIIQSATSIAADCMDIPDVGTLAPGMWADFLVLTEDPLLDISNTKTLESVWIAGNEVPQN